MAILFAARRALLPHGIEDDVVIGLEGDVISFVRPRQASDPPASPGLLVPGLVNAHLHLELGWASGQVPGGEGLPRWVKRLMGLARPPQWTPDLSALVASGTVLVSDISNRGDTASALARAGLQGVVQHELLGMSPARWEASILAASAPERLLQEGRGQILVRPSPHATYSTPPALIEAACRPGSAPASIHLSEDPDEKLFTLDGTGAFAALLDEMGVDRSWWRPPGCSPAAWLDSLSVLGPGLLCVHGVHLDSADMALLAQRGAPLALCPRSNLHIGGRLPDVDLLIRAGVHLCLGTDSLASSPSLDVLAEIPPLAQRFPAIPLHRWLALATACGADALGQPRLGRIAAGTSPGLVRLEVDHPDDLRTQAPPREILVNAAARW